MQRDRLIRIAACLWLAASLIGLPAHAQPARTPGEGFVDQEAPPSRPRAKDVEPVWRPPVVDTLATVRKRGVLRVGVAAATPMVMHDARGELTGFSVDIANKLAQDMAVKVEFVPTSWSHVVPDLLDLQTDVIISGLWMTPARALVVNFSEPTSTEGIYLIASSATKGKRLSDFNRAGIRLAVFPGTVQARLARELLPNATHVEASDDGQELSVILAGKADVALVPTFSPQALVKSAAGKLSLPLAEPVQETVTAMAVRKGDPDFLAFLNAWITIRRAEGWLVERSKYWSDAEHWEQ